MTDRWFGSRPVEAQPDGQEITLAYRESVAIAGVATWPDGRAPAGARAKLYKGDTLVIADDAEASGAFRLRAPADDPGPFRIVVHGVESNREFRGILHNVDRGATALRVTIQFK
jgi:hypothetical protein